MKPFTICDDNFEEFGFDNVPDTLKKIFALIDNLDRDEDQKDIETSSAAGDTVKASDPYIYEDLNEIQLETRQLTITEDLSETDDCATQVPKFVYQLDFETWLKRKNEIKRSKQNEKKDSDDALSVVSDPEIQEQKHMAWVNWIYKKQREETEKKREAERSKRIEAATNKSKKIKADKMFNEWCKKKETELEEKKTACADKEEVSKPEKRKAKLKYHLHYDDWVEKKKSHIIPKSYTYDNYPKPSWINPDPWKDPDL